MKKVISVFVLGALLMSQTFLYAAEDPVGKFAAKNIDKFEKNCQTELETYCQTVTPGEGRGVACLYAHNDKLSGLCATSLYEIAGEFKNAADNLNVFVNACQADIVQLCSKVAIGEGRILACLEKNKKKVSVNCRKNLHKVRGDLGKANQIAA